MPRSQPYLNLLLLFLFLSLSSPAYAEKRDMIVEFLCDYGKKLFAQGQLKDAAHEFSKALLVDPGNETAKMYLRELGLTEPLYQPPNLIDARRNGQSGYNRIGRDDELTRLIDRLQEEKNSLKAKVDDQKQQQKALAAEIQQRSDSLQALAADDTHPRTVDIELSLSKGDVLGALQQLIQKYEDLLLKKEVELQDKDDELQNIKNEIDKANQALEEKKSSSESALQAPEISPAPSVTQPIAESIKSEPPLAVSAQNVSSAGLEDLNHGVILGAAAKSQFVAPPGINHQEHRFSR